ncbi:MAG TPA: rhomboid family intramembrane serine protease [Phycisphaerales bacterium]|nr:rhomboid family intramembrane serine protease [Phycisphaerales bacterium]
MLPIQTSITPRRRPTANYVLIAINVVIFLLSMRFVQDTYTGKLFLALREWVGPFILSPNTPDLPARMHLWQFITYAFLHAGFWHIAMNMYFLYLFGANVNDKLGNFKYVCFYLAGGVFAGLGHVVFSFSPVMGASGAVAAVTGAYLVLFPKTLIRVMYWLVIFIDAIDVPAFLFILVKMIFLDNIIHDTADGVAYDAHLAGYAFGVVCILLLLVTGLLKGDQMNLVFVFSQWRRRRSYRGTVSDGSSPFKGRAGSRVIKSKEVAKGAVDAATSEKIAGIRAKIADFMGKRNLAEGAYLYLKLIEMDADQVLPRQNQLDVANQLMSMSKWGESAGAYEKFLRQYKSYEYIEQVELMLGILYSRYLNEPAKAMDALKAARERLSDDKQIKMCDEELAKLAGKG